MRKIHLFSGFVMFLLLTFSVCAIDSVQALESPFGHWSVYVEDDDIDAAPELVTELDTTYAQIPAADTVEVISDAAEDSSQTVTVYGVINTGNGKRESDSIALNGAIAATSTKTFRFVDQVELDSEASGTVTVRRQTGDTFIISVPPNTLAAGVGQHFNGDKVTYLNGWGVSSLIATNTTTTQLRWYPDDADSLDDVDGYQVVDRIILADGQSFQDKPFNQPKRLKAGGWLAVYSESTGEANQGVAVNIQGQDAVR